MLDGNDRLVSKNTIFPRIRFHPPFGHTPLYKEYNFARLNHQKHPTLMKKLGSKSLGLRGLGSRGLGV